MTTIFQHPLAYLLGIEGAALMRAFAGEHDRDFTAARIAEVRSLLDRADELGEGVEVRAISSVEGYAAWAGRYDGPGNPFFALDEGVLLPWLDEVAPGVAVDAACGTGRYTGHLVARGHSVVGCDTSPEMLARAREALPHVRFEEADMARLPVGDGSVDVVVNALAMAHVEDLGPVFAEAARVLRPGGRFLVSDVRGYFPGSSLSPILEEAADGTIGFIPSWDHATSSHLRAALDAGFTVRDCRELVAEVSPDENVGETAPATPGEPMSIWELHPWVAAAAHAVRDDRRCLITWDLELR